MPNATRWVGLDVHASQTACAIFDSETGEVITRRVLGRPHEVMGVLLELERPVRAVYEAGPTGYGLARRARAAGIDMQVCAPGMIARSPTERIKTDKRDAMKLARLHAAGQLVCVHVPSVEHEQLRDLARCREDARQDLMRAKHRIGKFLLRRELYYPGRGRAWTGRAPRVAGLAALRRRGQRGDVRRLPARPRHPRRPPRRARPHDRHARARVLVGRRRSRGCGACTASTRWARSGCAARSATSNASRGPPR